MTTTVVVNNPDQARCMRQERAATLRHRTWCRFDTGDECDGTCLSSSLYLELEHHPDEQEGAYVMAEVTPDGISAVFCNLGTLDGADLTPDEAERIGQALLRYAAVARQP